MSYKIILKKPFRKFFKKLEKQIQRRILKKMHLLKENPRLGKPLTGNLAGLWSLRVSKYRIIYEIIDNDLVICVLNAGHRKKVYD